GHIDAPIAVARNADTDELVLRSHLPRELAGRESLEVNSAWLVDVDAYGAVAFRVLPALRLGGTGTDKVLLRVSGDFAPREYNEANREQLSSSLYRALVAEGLFDDEAQALLDTWELSYFKSVGMRIFFLVPRAWTDLYLPLSVSKPAQITRVMVGRIELVTPQQGSNMQQIAQMPAAEVTAEATRLRDDYYGRIGTTSPEQFRQVNSGRQSLEEYGISVPRSYQLYLALGRFRNALLLHEVARRPTPALEAFIEVDVLVSDGTVRRFSRPRLDTTSTHGTGCTLSAAITAGLAHGRPPERAVEDALDFVHRAIAAAPGLGHGHGPLNHFVPAPPRPPT